MAGSKITDLTALTTPADDDVLAIVDDPGGTPVTKKITYANLIAGVSGSGLVLLEQYTASSSASLDFVTAITSAYDDYVFELVNVIPATNSVDFYQRMSTNGGVSYDSSSLYNSSIFGWATAGTVNTGNAAASPVGQLVLRNTTEISNSSNYGLCGFVKLFAPASANYKRIHTEVSYFSTGSSLSRIVSAGSYANATAVNAYRFLFSSGNIASGTIRCYGLAK